MSASSATSSSISRDPWKGIHLMTSALQSYLEAHDADARDLRVRLCRQPSVAAQHLGMGDVAALVEQLLPAAGFTTERFAVPDAPQIIFGARHGRRPHALLRYND